MVMYNKVGVTSFKIDNMAYPGNTYSYSHASSSIIHLEEGSHSVYISTQFDVRRDGKLARLHLTPRFIYSTNHIF